MKVDLSQTSCEVPIFLAGKSRNKAGDDAFGEWCERIRLSRRETWQAATIEQSVGCHSWSAGCWSVHKMLTVNKGYCVSWLSKLVAWCCISWKIILGRCHVPGIYRIHHSAWGSRAQLIKSFRKILTFCNQYSICHFILAMWYAIYSLYHFS